MVNRRITKEMANQAAEKMMNAVYKEKTKDAGEKVDNELNIFVKKYFPASVLACVDEYKEYFKTTNNIHLRVFKIKLPDGMYEGSWKDIYGRLSINIPVQDFTWDGDVIYTSENECEDVVKAYTYCAELLRESQSFYSKVNDILLSLKTEKKIKEQFPEALPYLKFPDDKSNLPAPIFSELRTMLQGVAEKKQ